MSGDEYDIDLGRYFCRDFAMQSHYVDDCATRSRHCRKCQWVGRFAQITEPNRDTDSLVKCPECGSVDLDTGGNDDSE